MKSYLTYTDGELVHLLRSGDRAAFEEIYRRWLPSLYDVTYKRLKQKEQTEDVLQEVFARVWVKREIVQIPDLPAYLHVAVRNETINYITRHKQVFEFYEPFETILLESDSADGQLIAKELLALVYSYAETLPDKRKEIFLLHVREKLTTREIADHLLISQKTVQNQLGTALQGLKTNLAPAILALITDYFTRK